MTIQVDSREKAKAITKILDEFNKQRVEHYVSKLFVGDYMSLDNPRLIVDRKQNLSEVCANVCQQHVRFRAELIRAREYGIKLVILIEHSNRIKSIKDVSKWENPRGRRIWVDDACKVDEKGNEFWVVGHYEKGASKAMSGEVLSKVMLTMEQKYGCEFQFCDKAHTGKKIIEILGGGAVDK